MEKIFTGESFQIIRKDKECGFFPANMNMSLLENMAINNYICSIGFCDTVEESTSTY